MVVDKCSDSDKSTVQRCEYLFRFFFSFCRQQSGNLLLSADGSPLYLTDDDNDDEEEDGRLARRRRLNVTEKNRNVVNPRVSVAFTHDSRSVAYKLTIFSSLFQLIKYCPICPFKTDDNKLTRHIGLKHRSHVRRPVGQSLREMGKIFGSESRRSITLLPMSVIREKMGPYWGDVSFRKIAFQ